MGADPNMAGNVIAGFNIDLATSYFKGNDVSALEYLALHEVAHDSAAGMQMYADTPNKVYNDFTVGTTNYANENFANTVALATMEAVGLDLGKYDPTTGSQTPKGDWETNVIWTINND